MLRIDVELTDTFGGEANYSWVRREKFTLPDNASDRLIMKRAKDAVLLTGVRGRWTDYGDQLTFRPYGRHMILFVTVTPLNEGDER